MKRVILLLLFACPAFGADFEAGIRHVIVLTSDDVTSTSRGFAATGEVFWGERLSTQFFASFVNPEAIFGDVDLGTLGLDVYSAMLRYHLGRFYAGGGVAFVAIGDLDDQFGDAAEATFGSEVTFVAEAGARFRLFPRVFVDVGASYMPLTAEAESSRGDVPLELAIDPVTVSAGLSYRF